MNEYDTSDDYRPINLPGGYAVYASHLLTGIFAASVVMTAVWSSVNKPQIVSWLPFYVGGVFRGELWRFFSYGFFNPPSLFIVVNLACLAWFGRELERTWGRTQFLRFCAYVYFFVPLVFTAIGHWLPGALAGESVSLPVFVAFATLFPNAGIFFGIASKWIAITIVSITALQFLSVQAWSQMIALFLSTGFAFTFANVQSGRVQLPRFRLFERKPKLRVMPDPVREKSAAKDVTLTEADALLDKIAKSGISSLTARERAKLEAAREALLKRDSRR